MIRERKDEDEHEILLFGENDDSDDNDDGDDFSTKIMIFLFLGEMMLRRGIREGEEINKSLDNLKLSKSEIFPLFLGWFIFSQISE